MPTPKAQRRSKVGSSENPAPPGKLVLTVSVRDLVEFAFRTGDLGGTQDFAGSNRALEGTRGHQRVQKSRPPGYQKEVSLQAEVETADFILRVQGRLDGLWPSAAESGLLGQELSASAQSAVILEEIKTVSANWRGAPDPLHWAQVKLYGAIFLRQQPESSLILRLVYLDLDSGKIREFEQASTAAELGEFFSQAITLYQQWMTQQVAWQRQRNQSIAQLAFPYPEYRPGQRKLAVAVYRAIREGQRVFACAPTGIGKTMSVLYPAIKAQAGGHSSQIFYLTARTSGRQAAEQAVAILRRSGLRLRSVTLTAKQKICFQPGPQCESLTCPFALGYFDRIKSALSELLAHEFLTQPVIETVARQHQVCPFELSLDAALWCDLIIADYNYAFDPRAWLRRFFAEPHGEYAFLIDEAHNLVDRAREMFSAALDKAELRELKRALRDPRESDESDPDAAAGEFALEAEKPVLRSRPPRELAAVNKSLNAVNRLFTQLRQQAKESGVEALALAEIPETWDPVLRGFVEQAEAWLAQNKPAPFREALIQFYFQVGGWLRISEWFDERFRLLWTSGPEQLRLFCLDPSVCLQKALERGRSAVFFSATLSPMEYFKPVLGCQSEDAELRLDSPFPPERMGLFIQDRIATHYRAREATYDAVAQAIATFVSARRGNYLVFFPSYQYLRPVLERVQTQNSGLSLKAQTPGMNAEESEAFLNSFQADPPQTQVGFAVLGGIFGEGIDLSGGRLAGAVVVGIGLPQVGFERNLIRDFFATQYAAGFEYAYLYPGMNRVLQAVGRVIRSEHDRGAVLLIDTRFREPRCRRLFPPWWQPQFVAGPGPLSAALEQFWSAEHP